MYRLTKDGKSRPKMKREKIPHSPKRKRKRKEKKRRNFTNAHSVLKHPKYNFNKPNNIKQTPSNVPNVKKIYKNATMICS